MTLLTRWEPFREFSTMQDRMVENSRKGSQRVNRVIT